MLPATNYESHQAYSGPGGSRTEVHEYRSYSSSGGGNVRSGGGDDFNLERQVQHMLPHSSMGEQGNGYNRSGYSTPASGLSSANMVSNVQQSQQSYSSYKVQTNQYDSRGERIDHDRPSLPPASNNNLKQNIDELDTLLYDLNNASKIRDNVGGGGGNYPSDGGLKHHTTHSSYSETSYHTSSSGKPPSPSVTRKPLPLSSPSSVRRASPQRQLGGDSTTSYKYTYSSSRDQESERQQTYTSNYPPGPATVPMPVPPPPPERTSIPPPTSSYPQPSPSYPAPPQPPQTNGAPTGASYYAKYHSTHSHTSQLTNPTPATFPSKPNTPTHTLTQQTPPKRVDHLLTELSEFDSSIRDTRFVEPVEPRKPEPEPYRPGIYREPSPERRKPQPSTPGPAVYYPPGEMFATNTTKKYETVESRGGGGGGARGQAQSEYSYQAKEKEKMKTGETKQGAAVVPICLPLCCAAPCVIM